MCFSHQHFAEGHTKVIRTSLEKHLDLRGPIVSCVGFHTSISKEFEPRHVISNNVSF